MADTPKSAAMCSHKPADTPDQSTLLQAILTELQQLKANQSVFEHKARLAFPIEGDPEDLHPLDVTAGIARACPHFSLVASLAPRHPASEWLLERPGSHCNSLDQGDRYAAFAFVACEAGCCPVDLGLARDLDQCVAQPRIRFRSF